MSTITKLTLPLGRIRWRARYIDQSGVRRTKSFYRKADAEAWLVKTSNDIAHGLHTPGSISPTVKDAAALWIRRCHDKRLERMTIKAYEEHVDLHIVPFLGAKKLAELTVPAIHTFADQLRDAGRSPDMVKRVIRSLGGIFREARRRGLSATAPTSGLDLDLPDRDDPRPVIPTKAELQAIITNAKGRWRPLILTAIFCGLRASELRGLRWSDVDFVARTISINQRADASHRIGKLKSRSAYPCPRLWSTVSVNGNCSAPVVTMVWYSRTRSARSRAIPT